MKTRTKLLLLLPIAYRLVSGELWWRVTGWLERLERESSARDRLIITARFDGEVFATMLVEGKVVDSYGSTQEIIRPNGGRFSVSLECRPVGMWIKEREGEEPSEPA